MANKALVLINTAPGKAEEVCSLIKQTCEVKSVNLVAPSYDVIAVVDEEDFARMGDVITGKIARIPGVDRWTVCLR